jgi:hypothetical protein
VHRLLSFFNSSPAFDGRSTLQSSKPVNSEVLFSVIDKMPMRRDEMRQHPKGGARFDRATSERNVE